MLVLWTEIKLQLHVDSPEFFMFGAVMTTNKSMVLSADYIKGTFYACRLSLNPSAYAELMLRCKKHGRVAAYPTLRSELHSLLFEGNSTKFTEGIVFMGCVWDCWIPRTFNGTQWVLSLLASHRTPGEERRLHGET